MTHFNDYGKLDAQIASLPEAHFETLHRGKTISQDKAREDEPVTTKKIKHTAENKKFAVVNERTKELAAVVSDKYDLIQHEEAAEPVIQALQDLGLNVEGHVKTRNQGNRAVVEVKFTEDKFSIDGDSEYMTGLRFTNSYDKSSAVKLRAMHVRLVCSNGMMLGDLVDVESMSVAHVGDNDIVEEVKDWIETLMDASEQFKELVLEAQDSYFERVMAYRVLRNAGLTKTASETIIREKLEGGTETFSRWELYNAVTNYITHDKEIESERYYNVCHGRAQKILEESQEQLTKGLEDETDLLAEDKIVVGGGE
jgi:hypothetical protein